MLLKKHFLLSDLKTAVLLNIVVKTDTLFQDSLTNRMLKIFYLKYESFKTNEIVLNVTTVFTVTFDEFTLSVMNKILK